MNTKVGVYICSGWGLSKMVDLDELSEEVQGEVNVDVWEVVETFDVDALEAKIKQDIEDNELNRVIIAGPSGRYFADRFHFGDDVMVERVPMRELVSWTLDPEADEEFGDPEESEIQAAASDYIKMAVVQMQNSEPPVPHIEDELSKDILVIGGGVAGMSAAIAAADAGYNVMLVEKEAELGGWSAKYKAVIPSEAPYRELEKPPHTAMIEQIKAHSRITLYTSSTIEKIAGQPGKFDVSITAGSPHAEQGGGINFKVGSIVQASGWRPYDPNNLADKYGYGKLPNIVTNTQLEEMALAEKIVRPSDGAAPKECRDYPLRWIS
ncbi:MAG: FAD-dependent oxidoreductase [Candidatus Electryoneaceae bacterium]|nr:FAD-dependent oxidoreductase [Candidatus Electryoneaceae bacterium]